MLPELILDSDSFENLIEEYRSQIAGIYPDWTDYNYHDPGITFLELFAWMQENQQYFMEQLGEEHYRQFFRMAGICPQGRCPAVVLAEAEGTVRRDIAVPAGTVFLSGGLPFETVREERIPAARIVRLERRGPGGEPEYETETGPEQGGLSFLPFGTEPRKGTSLNFVIDGTLDAGETYRLSVNLVKNGRNPLSGEESSRLAALRWEYRTAAGWSPLTVTEDGTLDLLYSGRIAFRMEQGPAETGDGPALRAVFQSGEYDAAPKIRSVSLSEIELKQIRTMRSPEGVLLAEGNGFPDQVYPLPTPRFLADSVEIMAEDIMEPGRMLPWKRTENLFEAGPEDRYYMLDEQAGTVRFGNGRCGLPPEGKILLTAMTESAGADGNIKNRSVFTAESAGRPAADMPRFRMSRRADAGRDPEKTEETLRRIVREMHRVRRAVTCRDYEEIVRQTPGMIVHSAHAWTQDDSPKTVNIVVRPGLGDRTLALTEEFRDAIAAHLEERRLLGTSFCLYSPEYIRVDISCEAVPALQYRECESLIREEILRFFAEKERQYGGAMEFGELYGRLDRLPCVRKISTLQLEPERAGVRRNRNGDLLPPPAGVFLPGTIEIFLDHYRN